MEERKKRSSPVLIIIIVLLVVIIALLAVMLLRNKPEEPQPDSGTEVAVNNSDFHLGYEQGVTVVDDAEALQRAVDEMYENAQKPGITVDYQQVATSVDGTNFKCYISNPSENEADMFVSIFLDPDFSDMVYQSNLLPPSTLLEQITLSRQLEPGTHRAFLVYARVLTDENGQQEIDGQTNVMIDLVVGDTN